MDHTFLDALTAHPRLVVLTGAGVSVASGIPTYRNDLGEWLHSTPIQHQEFVQEETARRRYWARSMAGWPAVKRARPNLAHCALARLESAGRVTLLVTQNVDRLHQRAGHRKVVDLHGRLDRVVCLECGAKYRRSHVQETLAVLNSGYVRNAHPLRPDGDAEIAESDAGTFRVPQCPACSGVLMPDVVFFGGSVPRQRVRAVVEAIRRADALLVVGSSLAVYSGFRFCRLARELGKAVFIINRGTTRADRLADARSDRDCGPALARVADALCRAGGE